MNIRKTVPIVLFVAIVILISLLLINILKKSGKNPQNTDKITNIKTNPPLQSANSPSYKIVPDPDLPVLTVQDTSSDPPAVINQIDLGLGRISDYQLKDVCPYPGNELLVWLFTGGSGGEQEDLYILSHVFMKDSIRIVFHTKLSYSGPDGFFRELELREDSGKTRIILDGRPLYWNGSTFSEKADNSSKIVLDSIPEKQLYLIRQEDSVYIMKKDTSAVKIPLESAGTWTNAWLVNAEPTPLLFLLKEENGYVLSEIFLSIYQIHLSRHEIRYLTTKSLAASAEHEFLYAYYVNPMPASNGINILFYPVKTFQKDSALRVLPPDETTNSQGKVLFHWDGYRLSNITPFTSINSYPDLKIKAGLPRDSIYLSHTDENGITKVIRVKGGVFWYLNEFAPLPGPELLTVDMEDGYKWHLNYKISIYGEIANKDHPPLIFSYESGYYKDSPIPHQCIFIPETMPEMLFIVESDTGHLIPELVHTDSSYISNYPNNSMRKYIWQDQHYQMIDKAGSPEEN